MLNEYSIYSIEDDLNLHHRHKELVSKAVIDGCGVAGTRQSNVDFSYVVVVYCEPLHDLLRCLDSILVQCADQSELVIVDNGLDAHTRGKLQQQYPAIIYVETGENYGCCAGRNIGAHYASGEIVAFVDADGYIEGDFEAQVKRLFAEKDIVAVRGKVVEIPESRSVGYAPSHYDLGSTECFSMIDTEGISAFKRSHYAEAGGFEENLVGGEGLVLSYRLYEYYGFAVEQFLYSPDIVLHHTYVQNLDRLEKKTARTELIRYHIQRTYPLMNSFTRQFIDRYSVKKTPEMRKLGEKMSATRSAINETINKAEITAFANSPLNFSVIIPCYNLGDLIHRAIDSVKKQTLQNIEIIIVDDVSEEDVTKEVLAALENDYKVIYHDENGGVSEARNTGIREAGSEYIMCLDADDHIEPSYLEKAKRIFDSMPEVGIVSCGVQSFGSQNTRWLPKDRIAIKDALVNSPVHTASCFRKADWENGAIYDPKLRGYEDWDHWLRILKTGRSARVIPEYLFNYYIRPGSKVETSHRNAFALASGIVDNHRQLYNKHFDYVIAKKHEVLGRMINQARDQVANAKPPPPEKRGSDYLRELLHRTSWRDVPKLSFKAIRFIIRNFRSPK